MYPPPEIRLPPEIRRGAVVPVYVKFHRPIRTGLKKEAGRFVRVAEPHYVRLLEARYGGELVFRYEMTPALADNPLVSFKLRATEEALLTVRAVDDRDVAVGVGVMVRFAR